MTRGKVTGLENADLKGDQVSFYWIAKTSTSIEVVFSVEVDGKPFSAKTKFNVNAPTVSSINTTLGPIGVVLGSPPFLTFGTTSSQGINMIADVATGQGQTGEFAYLQITTVNDLASFTDGTAERLRALNVLDISTEATNPFLTEPYPVPESRALDFGAKDSPKIPLIPNLAMFRSDERFKSYLMYRPAGAASIWVSLRSLTWQWSATVTALTQGQFRIDQPSRQATPSVSESSLPEWEANIKQLHYIPE